MHTLLLIAGVLLTVGAISEPTCSLEKHMNHCGPVGVDEGHCLDLGCCWKGGASPDENLCFFKNAGYRFFSLTADRIECGGFGIEPEDCERRGCFFSPKFGEPWCFYPNTNIDQSLCPADRVACGEKGINQDACEAKGCCWSPVKGQDGPACFYTLEVMATREMPEEEVAQRTAEPQKEEEMGTEAMATHHEEYGTEAMAVAPASEAAGTQYEHTEAFGTHEDLPGAGGVAVHKQVHGEEGMATHPPEAGPEGTDVVVLHGEEEYGIVKVTTLSFAEVRVPEETAESSLPAPDEDLEEHVDDWDLEEFFTETFEMDQMNLQQYESASDDKHEKPDSTVRMIAGCGTDVRFEEDCLKLPDCYWVPAIIPGAQQCFQIVRDPIHRSLGKFWKPQAVY